MPRRLARARSKIGHPKMERSKPARAPRPPAPRRARDPYPACRFSLPGSWPLTLPACRNPCRAAFGFRSAANASPPQKAKRRTRGIAGPERIGSETRCVLELIQPVETHFLDHAVAHDNEPGFLGGEVLMIGEGRDVDIVAL